MTLLTLRELGVTRRSRTVLQGINLSVGTGEIVGLIGPNGAGKTTLMRAALSLIPSTGHSSLAQLAPRARGRAVAWLPQAREIAWPVDVATLILLGRTPHLATGQKPDATDRAAVDRAIARMDLSAFRDRTATRLSGGEQARVLIARALAQDAPLLMADEPIAGLDLAHQIGTMKRFADLAAEGRSVIVSLHDLGLAARHCTRLVVIDKGRMVADGTPLETLTRTLVRDVFGVDALVQATPDGILFQPRDIVG